MCVDQKKKKDQKNKWVFGVGANDAAVPGALMNDGVSCR